MIHQMGQLIDAYFEELQRIRLLADDELAAAMRSAAANLSTAPKAAALLQVGAERLDATTRRG